MTITGVLSAASPMLMQCPGKATLSIWPAALKTQSWDFDPLQGLTIAAALFPFGPSRHQLPNRLFNWTGSAALATPALSSAIPNTAPTATRAQRPPRIDRDSCISALSSTDGLPQVTRSKPQPAAIKPPTTFSEVVLERWRFVRGHRLSVFFEFAEEPSLSFEALFVD